jgi:putative N-acetylmannosamine-6-phosphate epimerase
MINNSKLAQAFSTKKALKVISGLNNFDVNNVRAVCQSAEIGGATFVDIAADVNLIKTVKQLINIPVCVSAVDAQLLSQAVTAGADLVEIGNFDSFYSQGITFTAQDVLTLTRETRTLLPNITLSVTVPHILALDEQVELAQALVLAGADIIQTEGGTSSNPHHSGILGLIEKASPTLAAAYAISRAVEIPVMCASGLSDVTAPIAIALGASGIGVGSAINKLNEPVAMIAVVRSLVESLNSGVKVSV